MIFIRAFWGAGRDGVDCCFCCCYERDFLVCEGLGHGVDPGSPGCKRLKVGVAFASQTLKGGNFFRCDVETL